MACVRGVPGGLSVPSGRECPSWRVRWARFPEPAEARGRVSAPRAWFQVAICHPPGVRVRPVAHSCRRLIPLTRSLSQASFLATPR